MTLRLLVKVLLVLTLIQSSIFAQEKSKDTFSSLTEGSKKIDGYMPLYWSEKSGKMLMEVSRFNQEFLYQVSLAAGLGSNPVGLDRGQLGRTFVVYFERVGPKIFLVQPNYRFRALSNDQAEKNAVADSFAKSIIAAFKVEAEDGNRVLIDATPFLMKDAHGVSERIRQARQGTYRVDESRSAIYLPNTKGFPKNTEVETTLTFAGEDGGRLVGSVTPTISSVTLREHHSFVELPDNNYRPRKYDPRTSSFGITFYDYASPFTETIEKKWISRHRLEKKDPGAPVSEAVKPVVYYVDNGVPEPIRSALVEGAAWWNQAFEAAGFKDAFQVKVLPLGADPMDIRYNMIDWVHRSTRGWAYGSSVTDPRTGEIIKGVVSLDSQRIRQDVLIGTGLTPGYLAMDTGMNGPNDRCAAAVAPDMDYLASSEKDIAQLALARIRQLSAHEVGHTLGFAHNFAASTYAGRASVMDYPSPLVEVINGKLDISNAYARGIGEFDKFSVRYAYSQFTANEETELEKILVKGETDGMLFIDDGDARGIQTAHPLASTWDNGSDSIAQLKKEMEVRRIALSQFGIGNLPRGEPVSELEIKLLPLYLHNRYQSIAVMKSVGGLYFTYAMKTADGIRPAKFREVVSPERQREALSILMETIKPSELVLPQKIVALIPPNATGYNSETWESFEKHTDPTLDTLGMAAIATDLVVSGLLNPNRAARMIEFNTQDKKYPHFRESVDALVSMIWATTSKDNYQAGIQTTQQHVLVQRLIELAGNPDAAAQVRATANEALVQLSNRLKASLATSPKADHRLIKQDIDRFLNRPDVPATKPNKLPLPAGEPIGN